MLKSEATSCSAANASDPEELMPEVCRENVEEPHRREDGADKRFLNFDVMIDDRRVLPETVADEAVDVTAVKAFIEADPVETGIRMKRTQEAERRSIPVEERGRQAEKDSGREHQAECDPIRRAGRSSCGMHARRV